MKSSLLVTLLLPALAGAAFADAGDPPSRVARLNYMSGPVSFKPGTVDQWAEATLNYPLTTGDRLWADDGGGAELHAGSTAIRMGSRTALEILNLDDRVAQLSVTEGSLNVRLRRLDDDQTFEVDTPNGAIQLLRTGEYRFDVIADSATTFVTVRGGEAEVTGAGNPFTVHPGQMARITGADAPTFEVTAARPPDGWDNWCLDRDRREEQAAAASARYVPPEMIGYEDLNGYGAWRSYPPYGMVWVPRVAVGWAPYHYGHWAWVAPWGWTWIDDAPWGFAPFHYGRWAVMGGTWCWVPGAIVARPVYAPALVAFVGGPHFSVSVAFGGGGAVAWFPLGPREVYRPAYTVSPTYVRNVNITHVTNVTNITNVNVTNVRYVNQTVPGAVTAVPQNAFVSSRRVSQVAVPVTAQAAAGAQVVPNAAVAPRTESVLARTQPGNVRQPPAAVVNRTVVARNTPPPAPVPFAARQHAQQANPGRPVDPETLNRLRANTPAVRPQVRQAAGGGVAQPRPQAVEPAARPMDRPARPDRPSWADRPAQPQQSQQPQQPAARPQFQRPAQPAARPQQPQQSPESQQPAARPQFQRPAQRGEQPAARPNVERPAERARPAPEVRREANQERRSEQKAEGKERRSERKEERQRQ